MPRDFQINGECLVIVAGNGALSSNPLLSVTPPGKWELGLAEDAITISPTFRHKDINVDSYGPDIPAEVLWMLMETTISMTLVHFDLAVLNACVIESMAGGGINDFIPAGTPMGGGQPLYQPGNHYIGLNLVSPVLKFPWFFLATYLTEQPLDWPVGTEKSAVRLRWRAIPYTQPPLKTGSSKLFTLAGQSTLTTTVGGSQTQSIYVSTGPSTPELQSAGATMGGTASLTATPGLFPGSIPFTLTTGQIP